MYLDHNEPLTKKTLCECYRFEHRGVHILLDVENVDFFEIDEPTRAVLDVLTGAAPLRDLLSRYSRSRVNEVLQDLEDNGFLSEGARDVRQPEFPDEMNVVNLVLNVSHDCNLRCRYCFAQTGHYRGERMNMKEEVALQAVKWLFSQAGQAEKLNLTFFGGEPLLNLPLIKTTAALVYEMGKKQNRHTAMNICTNGTIMNDDVLRFIQEYDIGVQVSLDGPREIHDAYRPFPGGGGSYDTVIKNLERLFREVSIFKIIPRATIPHGMIRINEVVDHLFDLGFKIVFFIPALGCGKFVINDADVEEMKEQYNLLAEKFIEKNLQGGGFHIFPLSAEVKSIGDGVKRLYGCGAGLGFASVDVDGDIYPCMRFTQNLAYRLGNVFTGFDPEKREMFFRRTVDNRERCRSCWARYLCGGACISIPAETGVDMMGHDAMTCEVAQHITRIAMYINAVLTRHGVEYSQEQIEVFDFLRSRV